MVSWLKTVFSRNREPTAIIDDAHFGRLVLNHDEECWEGETIVAGKAVRLSIHAGRQGPSLHQRQLWRDMCDEIQAISKRVIDDYLFGVNPEGAKPVLPADFSLDEIELLPESSRDLLDYILIFSLAKDEGAIWRFEMRNGKVMSTGRDD